MKFSRQIRVWRHRSSKGRVWGWGVPIEEASIIRAIIAGSCLCTRLPWTGHWHPKRKNRGDTFGVQLTGAEKSMPQWVQPESTLAGSLGLPKSQVTASSDKWPSQNTSLSPRKGWSPSFSSYEVPHWTSRSPEHQIWSPQPLGPSTRPRVGRECQIWIPRARVREGSPTTATKTKAVNTKALSWYPWDISALCRPWTFSIPSAWHRAEHKAIAQCTQLNDWMDKQTNKWWARSRPSQNLT